jgi:predicted component of type VI protein secretion system
MTVNGTQLAADNGSVTLQDGDRVEMGEVVFLYRAK